MRTCGNARRQPSRQPSRRRYRKRLLRKIKELGYTGSHSQFQPQLLWEIVQFIVGATPTRIHFPQHTPHKQIVNVAQGRIRRTLGDCRSLAAGEFALEAIDQIVEQLHLSLI
jgi:hypothetical protein